MNVQVISKEHMTQLLGNWYRTIRSQNLDEAKELKKEIDLKINHMEEDQKILEYYLLLDFRYKILCSDFYPNVSGISKAELKEFNINHNSSDDFLSYYYYFFKATHEMIMGKYKEAEKDFEKAGEFIVKIPDEIEKAEYNFKLATYYYYVCQPVLVVQFVSKAKSTFLKQAGYDLKIAACDNLLGLACIQLSQFEQAEEYLISSINVLQKKNEESLVLRGKHSLGVMYAEQNLSVLAIRHLAEVTKKNPDSFRAVYLEAREYSKLGEIKKAIELIDKGLEVCNKFENVEYQHHFNILKRKCQKPEAKLLEVVILEGLSYFEKEGLWEYVQEYSEVLAMQFHEEGNHEKASKYFYKGTKEKEKAFQKGALR
ncbi:tetratricopeptide repeat protein [Bacillus cereus]|nr:tetratricopeptide repeat protein [Bacillus cereus]